MKKITFIFYAGLVVISLSTCKKVPDGNLSPLIRYDRAPIVIQQGRTETSIALNVEGSSLPLDIRIAKVYDRATGTDMTTIFKKKYPFKVWNALYDFRIDSTIELINAKRIDTFLYPISINSLSGQIQALSTTVNLPLGKYSFDLEIENSAGKRMFSNIGEFDLIQAPFFEIPTSRSTEAILVGNESVIRPIASSNNNIEVIRMSNQGDKLIVRFLDADGNLFNPKTQLQRRPKAGISGDFLQTLQDYALGTTIFDDRIEFVYAVVPFPFVYISNVNYYYRIPAQFVAYDASLNLPYNTYSCNFRFSFRAFTPGTYQIDITIPQVTRVL